MHCRRVRIGDTVAIVCGPAPRGKKCAFCGSRGVALCDFVLGKTLGGDDITCDRPICVEHKFSHPSKPDIDYCWDHRKYLAELVKK